MQCLCFFLPFPLFCRLSMSLPFVVVTHKLPLDNESTETTPPAHSVRGRGHHTPPLPQGEKHCHKSFPEQSSLPPRPPSPHTAHSSSSSPGRTAPRPRGTATRGPATRQSSDRDSRRRCTPRWGRGRAGRTRSAAGSPATWQQVKIGFG